jgi:LPXTG-site transpeptidase (sortase) family protein
MNRRSYATVMHVEATDPTLTRGAFTRPWLPLALGCFLAMLAFAGGYDNSGREPPCFGDFPSQHPEAVEFRDENHGWEQTCVALAPDGHVIAVKHYPGAWDWFGVGLALIAPLSLRAIWRRFRLRGVALALLTGVAVALAISEVQEPPESLARTASLYRATLSDGQTVGRLTFPAFDKTVRVTAGFDQTTIDRGPSWYPGSWLPGLGRTIYVAGHRRTQGGPFREIGELRRGDEVVFATPYAVATYSVTRHERVDERNTEILVSGFGEELRLQASTIPAGHERLVVFARLEAIERR